MTIYALSTQAINGSYRGCGRAWAAIVTGVQGPFVAAVRYMDLGTANKRSMAFADWRDQARRELGEIGEVVSGECSCTEFIGDLRT